MNTPVRTSLYDEHVRLNANIVDFHGFELPIWYSSITEEHIATRTSSGLFDVSHMGSFRFSGENIRAWLESVATQKVTAIEPTRCAYTHFLDHDGFVIDDMIFAVVSDTEILGVPNASMISIMWDWFQSVLPEDGSIVIENLSSETSIIALQGPTSKEILETVLGPSNHVGRFRWKMIEINELDVTGWIQGTGYTGEAGYEIFIPNEDAPKLWRSLVEHGATPVGLGARDTLRLEKGYLLSGVDFCWPKLSECQDSFLHRDSWETNTPFGVDFEHDFIGKQRCLMHNDGEQRLWGVKYIEKGPLPRPGKPVQLDGEDIGILTSGAPSPSLANTGIGMGYFSNVKEGDVVEVVASPRKSVKAEIIRPPFV